MWFRRLRKTRPAWKPRAKILIWATLIGVIFGIIEFGEPIENIWRSGRNAMRSQPAPSNIVVIGIDDRSLKELDRWPWPRRYSAQMIDNLRALGAKRIAFDYDFSSYSNPVDDQLLEEALQRAGKQVLLPVRFVIDPVTERRSEVVPAPRFARHAELGTINALHNPFGEIWQLYYAAQVQGKASPSYSSLVSGVNGPSETLFNLDLSIDVRSIPLISAVDMIKGAVPRERIAGKEVIIGFASDQLGDNHLMAGQGVVPGVFFQVIGMHTLRAGVPVHVGWFAALAIAFVLAVIRLYARSRLLSRAALAVAIGAAIVGPFMFDQKLIFADFVPATTLFLIAALADIWMRFRQRDAMINPVSGLPNLNALREARMAPGTALVAARIQNFAEITAMLPEEMEKILVQQIAARMTLGADGSAIYQGDEGIFVWLADNRPAASLGDQLEALHALFRSPVVVDKRHIDLAVAFGVDTGSDRLIGNRLGSALVAADEAIQKGLRWKAYDPARLEDAEWKLSLLGRMDAAIDNGEIWVAYQPKLDLRTGRICGAEALARWSHPEKGDISPEDFILAAEQHNRIGKLTAHVLNDAIRVAASVNAQGTPFNVAVNISARMLDNAGLVSMIQSILSQHGLEPDYLTLEVTESAAMTSSGHSIALLEALRASGIRISIDDYGTGFSTLEYLKTIPATEIKIDKGFVSAMDKSQSDRLMVNSTIELAHSLGRTVVAEGVEKEDTLRMLDSMGCDLVQGYLVGRPMPSVKLAAFLNERDIMVA